MVGPAGGVRTFAQSVVNDTGLADTIAPHAPQVPVEALPAETLRFLLGSRYCETDLLSPIAWQLFGHSAAGWGRVPAICGFVHGHITFRDGFPRSAEKR